MFTTGQRKNFRNECFDFVKCINKTQNLRLKTGTVWNVSKYGVISRSYFPVLGLNTEIHKNLSVFSPNTGKYGPEITPYLDTFHAVGISVFWIMFTTTKAKMNGWTEGPSFLQCWELFSGELQNSMFVFPAEF